MPSSSNDIESLCKGKQPSGTMTLPEAPHDGRSPNSSGTAPSISSSISSGERSTADSAKYATDALSRGALNLAIDYDAQKIPSIPSSSTIVRAASSPNLASSVYASYPLSTSPIVDPSNHGSKGAKEKSPISTARTRGQKKGAIQTDSSPVRKPKASSKGVQNKLLKSSLRRGKWTIEEETYVARVIKDFNSGYLRAPAGTTLRTYLSDKLHCDPMRITKKFTGDACIGKVSVAR